MSRKIYIQIKYKDKVYTIYKAKKGEWDAPIDCSDGRVLYPYEKEIHDAYQYGTILPKK